MIRSERRATFELAPDAVWAVLEQVRAYPSWWPWLRTFDGTLLAPGERWACTVRPPLPYQVSFEVLLRDVEPLRSIGADISGDISGTARIELSPTIAPTGGAGTHLHLVSELAPERPLLRGLTAVTSAIPRYGHDQILDRAIEQFIARLPTA